MIVVNAPILEGKIAKLFRTKRLKQAGISKAAQIRILLIIALGEISELDDESLANFILEKRQTAPKPGRRSGHIVPKNWVLVRLDDGTEYPSIGAAAAANDVTYNALWKALKTGSQVYCAGYRWAKRYL